MINTVREPIQKCFILLGQTNSSALPPAGTSHNEGWVAAAVGVIGELLVLPEKLSLPSR